MKLLVLPLSGGRFVTQVAILQHLCEAQLIPDCTLATSGGNTAAYLAAVADWKWAGLERLAGELTSDLFARPWNSFSSLALCLGFFRGNMYAKGLGVHKFFTKYFNEKTICKHEIWTGTYNSTRHCSQLYCNRAQAASIFGPYFSTQPCDLNLARMGEPHFLNGDLQGIAAAGMASASIPGLVPAEIINGEAHIDGAVSAASPLTLLSNVILTTVRQTGSPLHIIYVNCIDVNKAQSYVCNNFFDTLREATVSAISSNIVVDRLIAHNLIHALSTDITYTEFPCTQETLLAYKERRAQCAYSLLEIYPTKAHSVDVTNIQENEIVSGLHDLYDHCACRLWSSDGM